MIFTLGFRTGIKPESYQYYHQTDTVNKSGFLCCKRSHSLQISGRIGEIYNSQSL